MPTVTVNGVRLFYSLTGETGPPVVLVHGSWSDHHSWDRVAPALAERYRVLAYDRRGHSQSDRPTGPVSADQHGDDLAALVERLGLAPAHFVGSSFGGLILLRLAGRRPELFRSLAAHEPPAFGLLERDRDLIPLWRHWQTLEEPVLARLAAGDHEGAARLFVETVAIGPGAWEQLPEAMRSTWVSNAATFLGDSRTPDGMTIDLEALAAFPHPLLLTHGDTSMEIFPPTVRTILAALPQAESRLYPGAGHVPHASHPAAYVATLMEFIDAAEAERAPA